MKTPQIRSLSIALTILLATQSAYSADVAYQVDAERLSPSEPKKTTEPAAIAVVNREWCVPGVEQSYSVGGVDNTGRCRPRQELSPSRVERSVHPRFRIEVAPGLRWSETQSKFVDDVPWLFSDDVWPLTRDLWDDAELMPMKGFHGMSLATQR